MIRAGILALILSAAPVPVDYTVCTPVPTGPITPRTPQQPFHRMPDEAALSSGYGTLTDDDWPPMRFRKIGTITVVFTEQDGVDRLCGKAPAPWQTEACANNTRIVLPDPCAYRLDDTYARLACHELAHRFGGWPADTPR